uniref:PilT protein domain protein n=1 Tax=Cyanothece sp. (strain PCC 7425 / ATCC 29141) TaxID=395961 RepID=B8HZK3_CYAP4
MTLRYLLDTNILSNLMRPRPDAQILAHFQQYQGVLATSAPVLHELQFGCDRLPESSKRSKLEKFINEVVKARIPILPYDENAAIWHSRERARLFQLGKPPSFADSQIAAIAAVNQLTLVTSNVSDFENFQDLEIENWQQ